MEPFVKSVGTVLEPWLEYFPREFATAERARLIRIDAVKGAAYAERHRSGRNRVIDPETFEELVARITADTPLPDAALPDLTGDPEAYACACELDVIWRLTGELAPPSSDTPSA